MIGSAMVSQPASPARSAGARHETDRRVLGGVCLAIADRLGADPLVVRVVFIAAAAAGGLGVGVYTVGWVLLASGRRVPGASPPRPSRRAAVQTAAGAALLLLSALLGFRQAGLWFSDAVVWPLVLVAAGGALLWRQGLAPTPSAASPSEVRSGNEAGGRTGESQATGRGLTARAALVSRTGLGAGLAIAAGLVFLQAIGSLSALRDVVLAALAVAVVLGVIFAPWITRLVRSLTTERAERIRSQERAEMAAHLHDSVLQTLALVQRRADQPGEVAALARRQERELRTWLSGRPSGTVAGGVMSALATAAEQLEQSHGVAIEVVTVGDRALTPAGEAVVGAAREAMLNAVKFGGRSPVDVYAEAAPDGLHVFVRDRGPGFDRSTIPPDRRGVRESIEGRMARHGGEARIVSQPGEGTEVELSLGGLR